MKDLIKYLLILAIGLVIGFLLFKSCNKPEPQDHTQRIRELTTERDSLSKENDKLLKANDSLSTIKQQVQIKTVIKIKEIEADIAKDSSKAIVHYRNMLEVWGWLPDKADSPTLREIGLGARIGQEGHGFKLQLNLCEEQSANKDKIIADDVIIKKGYKENLKIKDLEIQEWKGKYDNETSFWNSNYLWFGVGILTTAAIIFLTGVAK